MLKQFDGKNRRGSASQYTPAPASAASPWQANEDALTAVSCDYVADNVSSYVDAELSPLTIQQIANHLNICPNCAKMAAEVSRVGLALEREWSDNAPLPSSLEVEFALDAIMDALPPVHEASLAPTHGDSPRIARWGRFTTGFVGGALFVASLWSSYQVGFWQGRASSFAPPTLHQPLPASPSPAPPPYKSPESTLFRAYPPKRLSTNII